jgi:hypothetical protein
MSATKLQEVNDQIQKFWSPLFMDELRAQFKLAALVNKEYQGEIKQLGDTVYVSQVNAPTGELRTAGTDADEFGTEQLSTTRVSVSANKRAVAAYEFEDLAMLQSQLGAKDSEIRKALVYGVEKQINAYLYSKVAPSTSSPDHLIGSVSDFNAAQLSANRILAAQAKWERSKGWWVLADPVYYGDILNAQTLTSKDYGADDAPVIGGAVVNKRFGFNILEDESLATDQALTFHPDFLLMVMQKGVSLKVSDLHSNKKFGFVISADCIFGAELGIAGSKKHILTNAGSATTVSMA